MAKKVLQVSAHEPLVFGYYRYFTDKNIIFDYLLHKGGVDFRFKDHPAFNGNLFYIAPMRQSFLKWAFDLRRLIKKERYQVIHFHLGWASLLGLLACLGLGVKSIAHIHSYYDTPVRFKKFIRRFIAKPLINRLSWYRLACSRRALLQIYYKNCGEVMVNAVDYEEFLFENRLRERSKFRSDYNLENKIVFLHVGNFYEPKNHVYLINVFYRIKLLHKNSVLLLAGDDYGTLSQIQVLVISLGLSGDVFFLGPRSDIATVFSAADIFLFPSIFEGAPISLLEAQVSGLPCLYSNQIDSDLVASDFCFKLSISSSDFEDWVAASVKCINLGIDEYSRIQRSRSVDPAYDLKTVAVKLQSVYQKAFNE